jgi:hypothetical protein
LAELVVVPSMTKRMKRFILNAFKATLVCGAASAVFDQVGPKIAGDHFALISWGIVVLSIVVTVFIAWRLYVGIQSGYLLIDDTDD